MKKIVLSLAGALAATAFAPEAAAVPAFARQVGMACTACHAQHFPVLNSFGRSFKAGGYTMMGAQGKVEGEHLSIPDTLNASIVLKVRHQKDNTPGVVGDQSLAPQTVGDGQWQFPDEFALLFGGRVGENMGFLLEGNMISDTAGGMPFAAGFKLPIVIDMGAAKVSVIPFITDALGVQYAYELSSGGVMRSNRWSEHRRETSAVQYNADRTGGGSATGFSVAAQNDMGFVTAAMYSPTFGGGEMSSTYVRVAATPTVGDWAMVVGFGKMSGYGYNTTTTTSTSTANLVTGAVTTVDTNTNVAIDTVQTFIDLQAQGVVAGKEMSVYVQNAKAPAGTNGRKNAFNTNANERSATTIGVDYSVMPNVLTVGAAYRSAKTGGNLASNGDNAMTVTAVYDLAQNVAVHLNYSKYSGSSRTAANAQTNLRTLMLEAAW